MDKRVLVAYASKRGATAEIAEKIGQKLRQAGLDADVRPADRAGDPASYEAVILGSAVYMFRWRKAAAGFLRTNERVLAERPVWLLDEPTVSLDQPAQEMLAAAAGAHLAAGGLVVAATHVPLGFTRARELHLGSRAIAA